MPNLYKLVHDPEYAEEQAEKFASALRGEKMRGEKMTTANKVYADAQKGCGLKVGDWVKVIRKAEDCEAGWDNVWPYTNNHLEGKTGRISELQDCKGICVYIPEYDDWWAFPYFVLEKIEKTEYEFRHFMKVLVRDSNDEEWRCNIFSHIDDKLQSKFICVSGSWKQCIPYKGNEHLVGITEKPKE